MSSQPPRPGDALSVADAVMVHARTQPRAIALVTDDGPIAYAELGASAQAAAAWLGDRGIREGDVVAFALEPSPAYVALLMGTWLHGAVAAPLNTRQKAADQASYLSAIAPRLIVDEEPGLTPGLSAPIVHRASSRPALILGTGGTTGIPKGAQFTAAAVFQWTNAAIGHLHVRRTDVELMATPFFHGFVLTGLFTALVAGATVRLMRRFDAERAIAAIVEDGVTRMSVPPTMLIGMSQISGGRPITSRIRRVLFSASAPPAGLNDAVAEVFPSAELMTGYGTTEYGPCARFYFSEETDYPTGCVGRPIPTVDVTVRNAAGEECAVGELGEITVRSPWQMSGYIGPVEAGAAVIGPDGAIRSGDLGSFDPDGRLTLRGRRKEMISTGGENVFPTEVEAVLGHHPAIRAIAVYGMPDPYWGERVEAAIVRESGQAVTLEDLRAFASERLAGYKLPKVLRTVDEIPLTPNSKIDRRELQRQAAG